jgi:hypothetical protein
MVSNPQRRVEWQSRLARWRQSGLSIRQFCSQGAVSQPLEIGLPSVGSYSTTPHGRRADWRCSWKVAAMEALALSSGAWPLCSRSLSTLRRQRPGPARHLGHLRNLGNFRQRS